MSRSHTVPLYHTVPLHPRIECSMQSRAHEYSSCYLRKGIPRVQRECCDRQATTAGKGFVGYFLMCQWGRRRDKIENKTPNENKISNFYHS